MRPSRLLVLTFASLFFLSACSGDDPPAASSDPMTSPTSVDPTGAGPELSDDMSRYSLEVTEICTSPSPSPTDLEPESLATFVTEAVSALGERVEAIGALEPPPGEEDAVQQHLVGPLVTSYEGMSEHEAELVVIAREQGSDALMAALVDLTDVIQPQFTEEDRAWMVANGMGACGF